MAELSDEELVKIFKFNRHSYEDEAIEAMEDEIAQRGIDLNEVAESIKDEHTYQRLANHISALSVSSSLRLVHHVIDTMIIATLIVIFSFIASLAFQVIPFFDPKLAQVFMLALITAVYLGYFIFMEHYFQKTVGKFVTGCKVVNAKGEKPSPAELTLRTFCRLIPLDNISFIFTRQGFHDTLSKTYVINSYDATKAEL